MAVKWEYKQFTGEVKATNDKEGIIEGYLNTIGNIDDGNDRTLAGAFRKTISDAYERKSAHAYEFLWPYLWNHDYNLLPPGGIFDADEDKKGLYIKTRLNLDLQMGRDLYSSFKMKTVNKQSMGYRAIRYDYVRDNDQMVRDLLEVAIREGSAVVFPMNDEAAITNVKSASGATDLPIADRDETWDGTEAHDQIVKWATQEDGLLDQMKMKQCHFWYDSSAPDKVTSYKLPFCYIRVGKPVAIPRGIFAVAAVLSGARGGAQLGGDLDAVKVKVASYYHRMAKQFNDEGIVPPWQKSVAPMISTKDFAGHYAIALAADSIEDWGDVVASFWQAVVDAFTIGDSPLEDVRASLIQFNAAVEAWTQEAIEVNLTAYLNEQGGYGPGALPAYYEFMRTTHMPDFKYYLEQKAGARLSRATANALASHIDTLKNASLMHTQTKSAIDSVAADLSRILGSQAYVTEDDNGKRQSLPEPRQADALTCQPEYSTEQEMAELDQLATWLQNR